MFAFCVESSAAATTRATLTGPSARNNSNAMSVRAFRTLILGRIHPLSRPVQIEFSKFFDATKQFWNVPCSLTRDGPETNLWSPVLVRVLSPQLQSLDLAKNMTVIAL